jgi:ribonuclease Z
MSFSVQVLGNNAAVPVIDRHPSAQILDIQDHLILIDCGEGTQMRLMDFQVKRSKIDLIFISHLHGDHIYGLPGLITSYNLYGREKDLTIFGPFGLSDFINAILNSAMVKLGFTLRIIEHGMESAVIFENNVFLVRTIPLMHRIPTTGYLFTEKYPMRKISTEQIEHYKVPYEAMNDLKNGLDWQDPSGKIIPNRMLTLPGKIPRRFAYCTDTIYTESIIPIIRNVDLLFHESTFLHEMQTEAAKRGHSTAYQAASIAKKANVKTLVLGHFSSRYKDLAPLLQEAKAVFPNTVLGLEGERFEVPLAY